MNTLIGHKQTVSLCRVKMDHLGGAQHAEQERRVFLLKQPCFSHEPTRHVMVSAFRAVTAEEDS